MSNQEEADTKVALDCKHALERHPSKQTIVRSPSGDIDILVIRLRTMTKQSQIYLYFGTGMHRKVLTLSRASFNTVTSGPLAQWALFVAQ